MGMKILVRINNAILEGKIDGDVIMPEIKLTVNCVEKKFLFVGYADGAPYYQIKDEFPI